VQQTLPGTGLAQRAAASYGPLLWAASGLALYLLGGVAGVFITALVVDPVLGGAGLPVEAGQPGLSLRNAIHPLVWGALVAALAAPIGRRLVPGIRFTLDGWLVLALGLVLAAVSWFLIEEFVRSRYAYVDLEYVGFSVLAWPALVAIALSGWAVLAVPRGDAIALIALLVLAAIGLAVALLPSVLGAADGIEAGNVPLALALLVDVAYAMVVVGLAFRRATAPPPVR
jgi:hypothetical protein